MSLLCPAAKEHLVQLHRVLICVYVPSTSAEGLLRRMVQAEFSKNLPRWRDFPERSRLPSENPFGVGERHICACVLTKP